MSRGRSLSPPRPRTGGRTLKVSEKVSFLVETTDKGVRVMVKGQPKMEEVTPVAALNA